MFWHQAGFRKHESDYSERMTRLHHTSKALRITVVTLNPLTSPIEFTLSDRDLMNWDHLLYTMSTKVQLPHGNGAIRQVVNLNGEIVSETKLC